MINSYLLLDDFSAERSAVNTGWKRNVSLKNNGGFIQLRLMLNSSFLPFNASAYEGIRLAVRGEGSGYYIFLRTAATLLPWKYYTAPVPVAAEWQEVDIPWKAFVPGAYGKVRQLKVHMLKSLALVAYGKDFDAGLDMKKIGLYSGPKKEGSEND